ncbi:Ig domain-containing protein [Chloroflexus sp.]|uniref:Ig domain-containing protein n=1 Tax=Chloroflexus sp. TaxID=1904827 RepID=UPI003C742E2A
MSGELPPGLTLHTNGRLAGQVTQIGTYTFTIIVSDGNGQNTSFSYEIVVEPMKLYVPIIMRIAP